MLLLAVGAVVCNLLYWIIRSKRERQLIEEVKKLRLASTAQKQHLYEATQSRESMRREIDEHRAKNLRLETQLTDQQSGVNDLIKQNSTLAQELSLAQSRSVNEANQRAQFEIELNRQRVAVQALQSYKTPTSPRKETRNSTQAVVGSSGQISTLQSAEILDFLVGATGIMDIEGAEKVELAVNTSVYKTMDWQGSSDLHTAYQKFALHQLHLWAPHILERLANEQAARHELDGICDQVLQFVSDAVAQFEDVPAQEKQTLRSLAQRNKSIGVGTDSSGLALRLLAHWSPRIQRALAVQHTYAHNLEAAKKQAATLQIQLTRQTGIVARETDQLVQKLKHDLAAAQVEVKRTQQLLATPPVDHSLPFRKEAETLRATLSALTKSYETRRQRSFHEVSSKNGCIYCCLLAYIPTRGFASPEQQLHRQQVWRFKDGENTREIAYLISIALLRSFDAVHLQHMTLAVIPASTAEKNRVRYEKFCEYLADYTGLTNGFSCIAVGQDRQALKGVANADKISKLLYNTSLIQGRHILLFDDVMTSGESFTQNARRLKECGANQVTGIFLARTQRV